MSFLVSVEPTEEVWGECEGEDNVAVAVGGDGTAESGDDDEESVLDVLGLDKGKVDTRLLREDPSNRSNWLTEQPGFRP